MIVMEYHGTCLANTGAFFDPQQCLLGPGLAACTHHWRQRLRCGLQGHAGHRMEGVHCITPATSSILSDGNHIQRKKIWQNTSAESWQSEMLGT